MGHLLNFLHEKICILCLHFGNRETFFVVFLVLELRGAWSNHHISLQNFGLHSQPLFVGFFVCNFQLLSRETVMESFSCCTICPDVLQPLTGTGASRSIWKTKNQVKFFLSNKLKFQSSVSASIEEKSLFRTLNAVRTLFWHIGIKRDPPVHFFAPIPRWSISSYVKHQA